MSSNSFLQSLDEPRFGGYLQDDVEPALEKCDELTWQRLHEMLDIAPDARTFDNTVLALTRSTAEYEVIGRLVDHLESVLGEPWRAVNTRVAERATTLITDIRLHRGLYQALIAYRDSSPEADHLSTSRRRLLDKLIRDYERGGVNLPADAVERLKAVQLELNAAMTAFGQNVVITSDAAGLALDDESALAGLDEDFIAACRRPDSDKPGLWLAYSPPDCIRVMTECRVRSTRQALYQLHITRTAEANEPLIREIVAARQELARLLGYPNYADFVLEERMARNARTARAFIEDLAERYRAEAEAEREVLQNFARELEGTPDLELDASDLDTGLDFYYANRLRMRQLGLDERELQSYFPLDNVLATMFGVLETLYGVSFRRTDKPGWQADVAGYEIHDESGHHLATVWCDWLARPGKRGGAWMNWYSLADRAEDSYAEPHRGYVCANFGPPSGDRPTLLSLDDVEGVWHEFGHFMHVALGRTELREQSMMNCELDFIEAPSQIMENWVWQPEVLRAMTKHYRTGEPLPESTIARLLDSRRFQVATKNMHHLRLAAADLAAHIDYDPRGAVGLSDYLRRLKQRYLPVPVAPQDSAMTAFVHIFAYGYGAAYYSYHWAEAIEADLFSRFAQHGVLNPIEGRRYRDLVLARGSEVDADALITAFLERPRNVDAMLERDGIRPGAKEPATER